MRKDAWAHVDNGEIRYRSHTFVIGKCQTSWRTTPVTILDRATVELVIQALEVAWANDDDGIYEHALKAVRGSK